MGQSKQLLDVGGEPLLITMAREALKVTPRVTVVLGANFSGHNLILQPLPVDIVHHNGWQAGMGSSLKAGLTHILAKEPKTKSVIILVCDQPKLTAAHLQKLVRAAQTSKSPIVASRYGDAAGVPALFKKDVFPDLLAIANAEGARKLIHRAGAHVSLVDFPGGEIDLDTPEDYAKFKKS